MVPSATPGLAGDVRHARLEEAARAKTCTAASRMRSRLSLARLWPFVAVGLVVVPTPVAGPGPGCVAGPTALQPSSCQPRDFPRD
jgi:hypothetical protein